MEVQFFDELGEWLEDQGVGTFGMDSGDGWGIYIISAPPEIKNSVVVTPTPSISDGEIPVTRRNFQVMVLSTDTSAAMDKAKAIYNLLHRKWNIALTTLTCYNYTSVGMPSYLGMDEQERAMIVANYTAFLKGQVI